MTDTNFAITDSAAIIEYLEECYPHPPLIGVYSLSRARVLSLERLGSELIARSQLWLWNKTNVSPAKEPAPSKETADHVSRYVTELLDVLENEIGERVPGRDKPTIADFTVFPLSSERKLLGAEKIQQCKRDH